jgi:hypothetical protein
MKNRKKEETKVEKRKGFSAIKQEKQGSLPNLFLQWNAPDQYLSIAVFETSHSCFQNSLGNEPDLFYQNIYKTINNEYAMINRL